MKKSTKTIFGVIALFIVISIVGNVYKNRVITIDARKLANVEAVGINGYGFITAEVDHSYGEKFKDEYRRDFLDRVNIYVSKEDNLSSYEKVTITVDCPEYALYKSKVKLKHTEFEYTVPELKEGEAIDIFEGLEVTISGVSDFGVAEITATPDFDAEYSLDKTEGLRNGDVIRVDVKFDAKALAAKGYGVKTNHKYYDVDCLGYYVDSVYDIDENNIDGCIKNGVQALKDQLYEQNNPEKTLLAEYPYIDFVETSTKVYFLDTYDENYELLYLIEGDYYFEYFWGLGDPTNKHIYALVSGENPIIDKDGQIHCEKYKAWYDFYSNSINDRFERLSSSSNVCSIEEYLG